MMFGRSDASTGPTAGTRAWATGGANAGSTESSLVNHRTLAYVSGASSSRMTVVRFGHAYDPGVEGHLGVAGEAGTVASVRLKG